MRFIRSSKVNNHYGNRIRECNYSIEKLSLNRYSGVSEKQELGACGSVGIQSSNMLSWAGHKYQKKLTKYMRL